MTYSPTVNRDWPYAYVCNEGGIGAACDSVLWRRRRSAVDVAACNNPASRAVQLMYRFSMMMAISGSVSALRVKESASESRSPGKSHTSNS